MGTDLAEGNMFSNDKTNFAEELSVVDTFGALAVINISDIKRETQVSKRQQARINKD